MTGVINIQVTRVIAVRYPRHYKMMRFYRILRSRLINAECRLHTTIDREFTAVNPFRMPPMMLVGLPKIA